MPAWTALPTAALWFPAVRDSLAAYRNSFALVRYARPSAALTARGWPPLPATSGRFSQPFEPTADQDYFDERTMLIGPDTAGGLLEIGTATAEGIEFIVHASTSAARRPVDDGRKLSIPAGPKVSTQRLECDHFGRLGIDPGAGR